MWNKLYWLVVFLVLCPVLTACAFANTPTLSSTPTPAATPGPYDGQWTGSGLTPAGKTIDLVLTVQDSGLSAATYSFIGQDGVPCTNLVYNLLPQETRPKITGQRLSAPLGEDLSLAADFGSGSSASGTLKVNWQGRQNCTIRFETNWTAQKTTQPAAAPAAPRPAPNPWCGNGRCAEIFLQLLVFGLSNGAVLALNALSVTVVYGAVRTLNLAHGDVFSLTSALVTSLLIGLNVKASWPPALLFGMLALALGAAMLFGLLLNLGVERLAFRPFRGRSRLAPLIATLGLSFILFQGAIIWRTHQGSWIPGEHRSVPGLPEVPTDGIPNLLPNLDLVKALGLPLKVAFHFADLFILLAAIGCAFGTYAFLRYTPAGRAIRACMQNPDLAQMVGIDLNAAIRRAFAFGGLLTGVAAFIFAVYYGRPFGQNGAQSGLFAFTAAMLGGIGNPLGALAAALLLGIFSSFSDYLLSAEWTPVLLLVLLIGLLFFRPTGFSKEDNPDDPSLAPFRETVTAAPTASRQPGWLVWILILLAAFPVFSALAGVGWQILVRGIGIFCLLALGLNLLLGLAGVLDLGFAAAFGIGAYTAAILTNPWGQVSALLPQPLDFLVVLLVSGLAAGAFGLLKGGLTARLRSDYLALATLAFGLLIPRLVVNLKTLTGGAAGISALPAPRILGVSFANPTAGYYLVFVLVAGIAFASQRLIQSRTGRAWLAGSDDETAAAASGVNVARHRLLALVLSSAIAGLAGALYASTFAYVDPEILSFHWTAMLLTMVILGGAGSVPGAVLGALLIIGYDKLFIPQFSALLALFWPQNFFIGPVPDLRGTSFFNFGLILYLTALLRARRGRS